jgi:hypothetical protein
MRETSHRSEGFSRGFLHRWTTQGMNSFMLAEWDHHSSCTRLHRELTLSKWSKKASFSSRCGCDAEGGEASDAPVISYMENDIYIKSAPIIHVQFKSLL